MKCQKNIIFVFYVNFFLSRLNVQFLLDGYIKYSFYFCLSNLVIYFYFSDKWKRKGIVAYTIDRWWSFAEVDTKTQSALKFPISPFRFLLNQRRVLFIYCFSSFLLPWRFGLDLDFGTLELWNQRVLIRAFPFLLEYWWLFFNFFWWEIYASLSRFCTIFLWWIILTSFIFCSVRLF